MLSRGPPSLLPKADITFNSVKLAMLVAWISSAARGQSGEKSGNGPDKPGLSGNDTFCSNVNPDKSGVVADRRFERSDQIWKLLMHERRGIVPVRAFEAKLYNISSDRELEPSDSFSSVRSEGVKRESPIRLDGKGEARNLFLCKDSNSKVDTEDK